MKALFTWLDGHSWSYGVMAGGSVLLALVWAWRGWREDQGAGGVARGGHGAAAGALLLWVLLAGRWPALLETHSAGVREAQLLSGAFAMAHDLMPYRLADLGAEGWLAAWTLVPTHWAGLPADYFVARFIGLLLDWGTLVLIHGMLRQFLPRGTALLGMLPLAMVAATPHAPALYQYTGWHAALWLTALTTRLVASPTRATGQGSPAVPRWIAAGLCLASIPWTTRGAAVLAIGLWSVMALSSRRAPAGHREEVFKAGGLALYGNVAILCLLHGTGQWERFWNGYVSGQALGDIDAASGLGVWEWAMVAVAAAGLICCGCAARWPQTRLRLSLGVLAVIAGVCQVTRGAPAIVGHFAESWRRPYSELGGSIRSLSHRGDKLLVWGVRPQLYIESGLSQAVSSGVPTGEIVESNPVRDSYRRRFLEELKRSEPPFVVDLGGDRLIGYVGRTRSGHEIFPELREYVRNYFQLVSDDGTARLYQRVQRARSKQAAPVQHKLLALSDLKVLQSTGQVAPLDETRWFAHAPSQFICAAPAWATLLQGQYGFLENAYDGAGFTTDGATFIVEAVTPGGRRERLLERRLTPVSNPDDRGAISFRLELPHGDDWEIRFTIEPGPSNANDWTYWGSLRFESER